MQQRFSNEHSEKTSKITLGDESGKDRADRDRQCAEGVISRSPAVAFIWKNAEGWPVEYVSNNVHSIFGWRKDDFLSGRISYSQVVHPDDLDRVAEEVRRCSDDKDAERVIHEPYRIVARDGSVRWVEDFTTILRGEDHGVNAYEGIILDITDSFRRDTAERKRVEMEQDRLRTQLESAVEIANLAPWQHDFVNDVFILNDQFYRVYHTTAEEVGGYTMSSDEHIRRFTHPDDIPLVMAEMRKIMAKADSLSGYQFEHRFLFPDGTVGFVAVRITFVWDADENVVKAYGVNQDITERKLAERERLAVLKYFRSMDQVNQAIQGGANDLDSIMGDVLAVCLSVFECDRAFLLHPCDPDAPSWSVPIERTRPEYSGRGAQAEPVLMDIDMGGVLRAALSGSGPVSFKAGPEYSLPEDSLEKLGVRSQMVIALHPKVGAPWLFGLHQCSHTRTWTNAEEGLFERIARRLTDSLTSLLMYRNLRKSEEFLDSIVENIPDAIFVKDAEELRFLRVNRAVETLSGFSREELIGSNAFELLPEEKARSYHESDRSVLEKGEPVNMPEETMWNRLGEQRIVRTKKIPLQDEDGKPQSLLCISEDITDLKKLQGQLNQAQKMEALGTMSGGVAHDFNNILQPMLGYCEFLKEDLPADSPQYSYVDGIFTAGIRAKELVNQILAFSRQSDSQMVPVELPLLLKDALKLCRSIISSNIDIVQHIQKDCTPIMADPGKLHQIIMNLMINAYHATGQAGGEIDVHLKREILGEEDLKEIPVPPGKYAHLSISDTGCGMAPTVLDKIFEPYFTTKDQGKGTGLGLAVVYGIVQEHGGHINADSEVGKGSTFNVYLPLVDKSPEAVSAPKTEMPRAMDREHILIVDDEEVILRLERKMLERLGYQVTSCLNGVEALAIFNKRPDDFDLVISDMNMPHMTGDRLVRELLAIRPHLPIIICTGFSEIGGHADASAMGAKYFLMKPIALVEMSQKVRRALDESRS